jgi:hypothetical protein
MNSPAGNEGRAGASCPASPGKKFHGDFAGKHPLTITTVPSLSKGACVAGGLYFVLSPLDARASS